jgi:hypothetical protein
MIAVRIRMLGVVLVALVAVPAVAGDGQVPPSTLRALGLGGMQVVPDAQGMQVRGKLAFVSVRGSSFIFGELSDGSTTKHRTDADSVSASDSSAASGTLTLSRSHSATINFSLSVGGFSGHINGFARGMGSVSVTVP